MNASQTAKKIVFIGRVQGVGFRYTTHRVAMRYEIAGYVKNLPNGDVEMFAQGDPRDIDNCLDDIQDTFGGYIKDTKVQDAQYDDRYTNFGIAY